MYTIIDQSNWPRKAHFDLFKDFDYPHFSLCANVDITLFLERIKQKNQPIFLSILHAMTHAANSIPELRLRIRDNEIRAYDVAHPSYTIMTDANLFGYCLTRYDQNSAEFILAAQKDMADQKQTPNLYDEPGRDDVFYITSIPWVSFTSMTHPIHMHPVSSIPLLAWGKFFEEHNKTLLPVSIQVHHGLVDGMHVGQFYEKLQLIFDTEY